MIGVRLRKANLIAKKRFKRHIWHVPEPGCLRKNNTVCSCQDCCNPRHSWHYKGKTKLTIQERKAPTVEEFELPEPLPEIWGNLEDDINEQYLSWGGYGIWDDWQNGEEEFYRHLESDIEG